MQAVRSPAFALVDDDPCLRRGLGLGAWCRSGEEVLASLLCGSWICVRRFGFPSSNRAALEATPTVRTFSVAPHLRTERQRWLLQEL